LEEYEIQIEIKNKKMGNLIKKLDSLGVNMINYEEVEDENMEGGQENMYIKELKNFFDEKDDNLFYQEKINDIEDLRKELKLINK
jgi:hypothetical protein